MSKEQQARDKRLIDGGLAEIKQLIGQKKYDECARVVSRISPPIRRLEYREYELTFLHCMLKMKTENWAEARSLAQTATRLKPDDPLPWRLLLQIDTETKNPQIENTIMRAFETCKPDTGIIKLVAPHLIPLDNEKIVNLFMRTLQSIPDGLLIPVVQYLPETTQTLELRLKMLKKAAPSNQEACISLIHCLLEEGDIFQAPYYAGYLPAKHPERIYVDALFGDDPIKSAKEHLATGSDIFKNFIDSVNKNDLQAMRNAISVIPPFVSGWIYYIRKIPDPQMRLQTVEETLQRYNGYVPLLIEYVHAKEDTGDKEGALTVARAIAEADPLTGTPVLLKTLIKQDRVSEAEEIIAGDSGMTVTTSERAKIDLLMYKKDQDKSRLRRILELTDDPEIAAAKAEAAFELRDELGDDCEKVFASALKSDRENPIVYMMFGKWQLERGDEDKAVFLFQKAYDRGYEDPAALELTSRALIGRGDLESALELCQKSDTEWSHFRSGLLLQRLGRHEEACEEFQRDLRKNPNRRASWSALGHSYTVLGRAMAAMSVADKIRELGEPDLDLEYQLDGIFGAPILLEEYSIESFGIEKSPLRYQSYLVQTVTYLRNLSRLGRKAPCDMIIDRNEKLVERYVEIWGQNASVLKICADFFIEAYLLRKNTDYSSKAKQLYMRRAEIDRRAEAFIDLARALQLCGQPAVAVNILRRALKAFPEHAQLWLNLGIGFSMIGQNAFSRHCLCVAAKIATNTEMARAYACVSAVAMVIDDDRLLETSITAARSFNPYDPDVWQVLLKTGRVAPYEASKIAFDFGASESILENIPLYCLKSGRASEALGFALMTGNSDLISDAFEANNRYDFAMLFAKDEKRIERLRKFTSEDPIGNVEEAKKRFEEVGGSLGRLGIAALAANEGRKEEAAKEIMEIAKEDPKIVSVLEKIALQIAPEGMKLDVSEGDSKAFWMKNRRIMATFDAAKTAWQRFERDPQIVHNYVTEVLRSERYEEYEQALKGVQSLMKTSSDSSTIRLQFILQYRLGQRVEASKTLQSLMLLDPSLYQKFAPILNEL